MKSIEDFVEAIMAGHADRKAALDSVYQSLENAGLISKVTVHRWVCARGCGPRATAIRAGDLLLVRTEDYKFSAGYNVANSDELARADRTLDGYGHWPKHTLDVEDLAAWGGAALIRIPCRHRILHVDPTVLREELRSVIPGRPDAPTQL